jgi:hypothetical protein
MFQSNVIFASNVGLNQIAPTLFSQIHPLKIQASYPSPLNFLHNYQVQD